MDKIASLKTALLAAIPELRRDPDKLAVFVDKGRVVARRTPTLSWEYRYTVRLWFEGFPGGPDQIFLHLLLWARTAEPRLLSSFENDDGRISFSADIIDEQSTDILIAFDLTEPVAVEPRTDGSGWDVTHLPAVTVEDTLLSDTMLERIFAAVNGDPPAPLVPIDPDA